MHLNRDGIQSYVSVSTENIQAQFIGRATKATRTSAGVAALRRRVKAWDKKPDWLPNTVHRTRRCIHPSAMIDAAMTSVEANLSVLRRSSS